MTSNRNDSVSTEGRVLFVCGTVLGVCFGFAAGHVTVWTRAKSTQSDESSGWARAADDAYRVPALGEPGYADSGILDSPSLTTDVPGPFFAKAARRLSTPPPIDVNASRSAIRVATETSAGVTTPDSLPESSSAAPIDEQTRLQEQVTRSIIAQELPHASPQEQEVWFDVLQGLDAADVKGILRMRKHVGVGRDGTAAAPGGIRHPFDSFAEGLPPGEWPIAANRWTETRDCLRQVRDIRLHNLCNADTIGFQRLEPCLCDVRRNGDERSVRLVKVQHVIAQGQFHETGRALDVAINGPGFLQVRIGAQTRLTRCGRLMIDEERRLALATTSEPWRLDPPIVVPEDAASLTCDVEGHVTVRSHGASEETDLGRITVMTVLDPAGLRYDGEGLFATTGASGEAYRLATGSTLVQFGVERPAESATRDELGALEREEQLIERLERLSRPHTDRLPGD